MKAAIYIRVSTERQSEEGFSLEAQHDILMELLEKKGLELYRVYSDPGISGKTIKKRPGIQQLLQDMKDGRFEAILIHKLDRLSRNLGDLYEFIALVNKLNVRLVIASLGSQEIDTISPMGKAFLYFNGIFAEIYSDNLREETLKGLEKKMLKGGIHMSRPPLGYDAAYNEEGDRYLVINEHEADLVRKVFRMYLDGNGVVKIAKHMNTFSRGKEGGVWDSKYIKDILKNWTYTGRNHFKPDHWEEEKRIVTDVKHEAIISDQEFKLVEKMMERKAKGHMSKSSYDYPYGGIIRCGDCGATYVGTSTVQKLKSGKKIYKSYRCRNHYTNGTCGAPSIQENSLNALVFEKIMITSNKIQEKKESVKAKADKRMLTKEVETSNRRRKNWMMALGDGKLSPDDYATLIDEEEARMKEVYAQFQDEEELYINELDIDQIKEMMVNIKDNWELLEPDTQKQLIQSMFRKIVIKKESNTWNIKEMLTV